MIFVNRGSVVDFKHVPSSNVEMTEGEDVNIFLSNLQKQILIEVVHA